jgi:hypothetical protein
VPVNIFVLAPGAFLVLAWLVAIMNKLKIGAGRRPGVDPTEGALCGECVSCMKMGLCDGKSECAALEGVEDAVRAAKAAKAAAAKSVEAAAPAAKSVEAAAPATVNDAAANDETPSAAKIPAEEMKKEEV